MDEKKKFEDYMEDYNLAILPHKKYYDLKVYFFYTSLLMHMVYLYVNFL